MKRFFTPINVLTRNLSKQQTKNEWPKKIFSGIQPTGAIHLGNYLGAIRTWINLQNAGNNVTYSIVDLHSITLPQDPKILSRNILELTATLLATGLDPDKCTLFVQSEVPQHTSLAWHLACLTTLPRLSHLPQFKEKSSAIKDVPLGLFIYPVLQAADILVHRATHVPVGEDQVQHLQLSTHLAKLFNQKFGRTFPSPQALIADDASAKIKSLRDPLKKMSKSDVDVKSRINLLDTDEMIVGKVKKAVTDFTPQVRHDIRHEITYDPENRAGISNLINIHALLTNVTPEEVCHACKDKNTLTYKYFVADVIIEYLRPIRTKTRDLLNNREYLERVLQLGKEKAERVACETMRDVNERVGTNVTALR